MAQSITRQNPKLVEKELANGKISLSLEYYIGREYTPKTDKNGNPVMYTTGKMAGEPVYIVHHERKKEALGLFLIAKPRTPEERQQNKDTRLLAEKIRYEREQNFLQDKKGYSLTIHRDTDFITFFDEYLNDYNRKDKRNVRQSLNRFKAYLQECRPSVVHKISRDGEEIYSYSLNAAGLNRELIEGFIEYLKKHSTGTGALTTYKRFKKVCKYAYEHKYIKSNPCDGIAIKKEPDKLTKDVLTADEITKLVSTHCHNENTEIHKAFIFSLFTGLRFCDVSTITYKCVNYDTKILTFTQAKTSGVAIVPLREELIQMIGYPEDKGKTKESLIFDLPSHTMCLKSLSRWVKKAGIDKHITWHCARHSFATNILANGANIKVVADLLGHRDLSCVDIYVRALAEQKLSAVESLPKLNF